MPLAGASQALPHSPQFCASVLIATQAEPHSSKPAEHTTEHSPPLQDAAPLAGIGQAMPQ